MSLLRPLDLRIGMFGFSAGGFTALVAVGGTPNMRTVAPYRAAHPDEWSCRMLKERTELPILDVRFCAAVGDKQT
jgi:predicted dienelactone hydrolase